MLLARSFHKLLLQSIPLLKSRVSCKFEAASKRKQESFLSGETQHEIRTFVGTQQCCVPRRNQILSVVISTLALPAMFAAASEAQVSQTTKAKESAAKQFVGAMNRAQQAYYAENTGFTSSVSNLGLGIRPSTDDYNYSITAADKAVFNYGISKQVNLKSFVGGVFLIGNTTKTILCQTNAAGTAKPTNPANKNGVLTCGANTSKVTR